MYFQVGYPHNSIGRDCPTIDPVRIRQSWKRKPSFSGNQSRSGANAPRSFHHSPDCLLGCCLFYPGTSLKITTQYTCLHSRWSKNPGCRPEERHQRTRFRRGCLYHSGCRYPQKAAGINNVQVEIDRSEPCLRKRQHLYVRLYKVSDCTCTRPISVMQTRLFSRPFPLSGLEQRRCSSTVDAKSGVCRMSASSISAQHPRLIHRLLPPTACRVTVCVFCHRHPHSDRCFGDCPGRAVSQARPWQRPSRTKGPASR